MLKSELDFESLVDQRCLELNRCQEVMIRLGRNDSNGTQKESCLFDIEPSIAITNLRNDSIVKLSWKLSHQGFVLH
jgi:hypothetical protein